MKISKLFHWLYAGLMVMPLFAILSTCCYVVFNPNAKDSYSNPIISYYQYETNEVNNVNDLVTGNIYHLELTNFTPNTENVILTFSAIYNQSYTNMNTNTYAPYLGLNISQGVVAIYNEYTGTRYNGMRSNQNATITLYFDFVYVSNTNVIDIINYISQSSYLGELIETQDNTLDKVFYYAVDTMNDNPFFAWSHNSFLSSPILYITSLFNMPSNSAIILLLCYWFNISIIWLTFDVMIYVPLVVHRWLDKGGLE